MHAPHEIARADAIRWVRIKMAQSGLTLADLLAAGCFAPTAARPRYRKMPRGKPGMGEGSVPTGFSGPSTPDSSRNSFRSTEESAQNAPGSMTRGALARGRHVWHAKQFRDRDFQGERQPFNDVDRQIAGRPFDVCQKRTVHVRLPGQIFLRPCIGRAQSPNIQGEQFTSGGLMDTGHASILRTVPLSVSGR